MKIIKSAILEADEIELAIKIWDNCSDKQLRAGTNAMFRALVSDQPVSEPQAGQYITLLEDLMGKLKEPYSNMVFKICSAMIKARKELQRR